MAERTAWVSRVETPLREFLRTETAGAAVLLAAAVAALLWANADAPSYEELWRTEMSIAVGDERIALTLREWINAGLMTFFFFVLGVEARREFDLGELRDRRRLALPMLAAIGGMALAVAIYLALNLGGPVRARLGGRDVDGHGAGARAPRPGRAPRAGPPAGLRADRGRGRRPPGPGRHRHRLHGGAPPDAAAVGARLLRRHARRPRGGRAPRSGVLPARRRGVGGAARVRRRAGGPRPRHGRPGVGLPGPAVGARARRRALPEVPRAAHSRARALGARGDPDRDPAERAAAGALAPVDELRDRAAVRVRERRHRDRRRAARARRLSRGRLRPPVGWAAVLGAGTIAGVGFTVSLLVATLAFDGARLEEAKAGVLGAAAGAAAVTWLLFRATALLPKQRRIAALLGGGEPLVDLAYEVDPGRDHIRGPLDAPVTVVEYGDFECPYCGRAEPAVRELLRDFADVRYIWRHLPLPDVHPHAELAAEASEAAAAQGAFWPMHDLLLAHQDALEPKDFVGYAEQLGLDAERFSDDLRSHAGARRIAEDIEGADLSGVTGTPTFFVNGRRHYGAYDLGALMAAVRAAGARAMLRGAR